MLSIGRIYLQSIEGRINSPIGVTEESNGPQISGQPTTININAGPQVSGGMPIQTNAVAGLVLAILGIVTVLSAAASSCGMIGCCGLIFTIPAMFLVSSDKKKIEGSSYHPEAGMINASNVVNIISLVVAILGIVIWALLFGGLAILGA
tara:strand:- start:434 stop:880 length:447 start_codon:yes stop_codon:yes gene_type:complete